MRDRKDKREEKRKAPNRSLHRRQTAQNAPLYSLGIACCTGQDSRCALSAEEIYCECGDVSSLGTNASLITYKRGTYVSGKISKFDYMVSVVNLRRAA
jgi:hypothetical protein